MKLFANSYSTVPSPVTPRDRRNVDDIRIVDSQLLDTFPRLESVPVLEATGLSKSYHRAGIRLQVLQDASMEVFSQEIVMIAGPSGSGKSTLLAILGGLLTPEAGTVIVDGVDAYGVRQAARARLRAEKIGYIFQKCHLFEGLSAAENVMMVAALQGKTRREARQQADELLAAVGLSEHATARASQMSLGQCQRVAVARALAANPKLLLADEPTASLDQRNGEEVVALIRELGKQAGRAAVIVTHDRRIFPYADRLLWVADGRIEQITHPSKDL